MIRIRVPAAVALALSLLAAAAPRAQQMSENLTNAQALFQAQKWAEAVKAYEAVIKDDPADPRPKAGLAASLYALGEFERALPVSLDANRILADPKNQFLYPGLPVGAVMVRAARIYNRLGKVDEAFSWLEKAAAYPIPNVQSLDQEADVSNLRADARRKKFTDSVRANADPCHARPEFRQFVFWVGEWDVLGASGRRVGGSRVERVLGNCALMETYTAAPGSSAVPNYVGQAFHFFDTTAGRWVQHYIDTAGTPWDWTGEFKDGAMRYTREGPFGPSNMPIKQRMTFSSLPEGKVRQLFEQSIDGGATWRAGFDGTYVKRTASQPAG